MPHRHGPRDFLHVAGMLRRDRRRRKVWERQYEAAIRSGSFALPSAAVVTIVPTEQCNLRCPMCNQWGEEGYLKAGARAARHMDEDALVRLFEELSPEESMLNVHGGEPLVYRHMDTLLGLLRERQFDVVMATNGTRLEHFAEPLAGVRNLTLILSIDGEETAHDKIRGPGVYRKARAGLRALYDERRRQGLPLPIVILSFVVCEWNPEQIDRMFSIARDFGVFVLNYNLRYFMPEEAGLAYEKHLEKHFGVRSTGAWRGWVSPSNARHDYRPAAEAMRRTMRKHRFRVLPPYVFSLPKEVRGSDYERYFSEYLNTFGNDSCFMPFYWARVHSNGDMIYCPGHPDVIVGNAFRDGFRASWNSDASIRFRRHILEHQLPICNRCCGLYMSYAARPQERRVRRRLGLAPPRAYDGA